MRVATIAEVDLTRRFRNRSLVVTAFVAPLALALVLGWILGGISDRRYTIGLVDGAGTPTSAALVSSLLDADGSTATTTEPTATAGSSGSRISFRRIDTEEEAAAQVRDGSVSAAIVVPPGFDPQAAGDSPALVVLQSPRRTVSGQVAEGVAVTATDRARRASVARLAAEQQGLPDPDAVAVAAAAGDSVLPVEVVAAGGAVSPMAYFGASMSIVFLFFTVGYASRSVMIDRERGMLGRLLSTPTSLTSVIAGKALSVAVLGALGFVGVWAATSLVFGARWGSPLPVLILILASVTSIAGLSLFVSSFGKTERQADAYATIVTFVLALLGGNFVPVGSAPETFRRIAALTPNGWALRGFTEVSAANRLGGALEPAAILVATGVVFGAVGFARLHRTVAR